MKKEDTRPVLVETHGASWDGWFHLYRELKSGDTIFLYAMIEDQDGKLRSVDLSYNTLIFKDR